MRPPRAFAQLREWCAFYLDSKNASCCLRTDDDEEIRANPEGFDCATCEYAERLNGLWFENVGAWDCYLRMCGRTVQNCDLQGWLFQRWTEGWSVEEALTLVDRLDIIASVLEPSTSGPTET